eukprot:1299926-Amphidinium_carterae.1
MIGIPIVSLHASWPVASVELLLEAHHSEGGNEKWVSALGGLSRDLHHKKRPTSIHRDTPYQFWHFLHDLIHDKDTLENTQGPKSVQSTLILLEEQPMTIVQCTCCTCADYVSAFGASESHGAYIMIHVSIAASTLSSIPQHHVASTLFSQCGGHAYLCWTTTSISPQSLNGH